MEKLAKPAEIAERCGLPVAAIRAACNRGEDFHPLPHFRSGEKRPTYYIRPSDFDRWFREETCGER